MNFLAHLYLAGPSDESLIGNLMGDFVKGTLESLSPHYSTDIIRGIQQHRSIDVFTDTHASFSHARQLLSPERQRFAGIVVDIFYDHFLSLNWPGGDDARLAFIARCYETFHKRDDLLSDNLRDIIPRMIEQDWLGCYSTIDGIALTLKRIAHRSPKVSAIIGGETDLLDQWDEFETLYNDFFPDLKAYSESLMHLPDIG